MDHHTQTCRNKKHYLKLLTLISAFLSYLRIGTVWFKVLLKGVFFSFQLWILLYQPYILVQFVEQVDMLLAACYCRSRKIIFSCSVPGVTWHVASHRDAKNFMQQPLLTRQDTNQFLIKYSAIFLFSIQFFHQLRILCNTLTSRHIALWCGNDGFFDYTVFTNERQLEHTCVPTYVNTYVLNNCHW